MSQFTTAALAALALFALAPAARAQDQAAEGQRLFQARCASCHSVEPGTNRLGPSLAGIVGRRAGAAEGARYSNAMRSAGTEWNAETLGAFLANPRQVVPGTTMPVNLPNAEQRAAVIAYLATLH